MGQSVTKSIGNGKTIAENRKARHDYGLETRYEAGVMLTGTEVLCMRAGMVSIAESYVSVEGGELWLINASFRALPSTGAFAHEERRPRKLLVHRRELSKIRDAVSREGMTAVALKIYFNERGRVKLAIATAKGLNKADKRERDAKRDWDREKGRLLKRAA